MLKPVDDVRMYEKFARSIVSMTDFSVEIIGFHSSQYPTDNRIRFHKIFDFSRLSLKRLLAPLSYYAKMLKLKVDVILCNSPDLQLVTAVFKIIFGGSYGYDIRENYMYNIFYLDNFSWILKGILGCQYRMKEWVVSYVADFFLLAERSYAAELKFTASRHILVENQYAALYSTMPKPKTYFVNYIYSGTISKAYGLDKVLAWAGSKYQTDQNFVLHIVGFCPVAADVEYILSFTPLLYPYLTLNISSKPLSHTCIIEAISEADIGILRYDLNRAIIKCVPAKLYEYVFNSLFIESDNNSLWKAYISILHNDVDCDPFSSSWYKHAELSLVNLTLL